MIVHGDCLEVLGGMEADSADSFVTDPPYGLAFMGKDWDHGIPGQHFWEEALRVAKPGAHLLAFGGTRTFHRLAVAIEDAGWEIRDTIMWVYGCLSEDTEVLTPDGWERYHTANGKQILTYDVQDDIYQWETPERWSAYHVKSDTAYRIVSSDTDQIVSRGHRCLIERNGELVFVAADELSRVERVPTLSDDLHWLPEDEQKILLATMQRALPRARMGDPRSQGSSGVDGAEQGQRQGEYDWPKQPCLEGGSDVLQAERQVRQPVDQVRSLPTGVQRDGTERWVRDGTPSASGKGVAATAVAERVRPSQEPRCDGQHVGESDAVCVERGTQTLRTRPTYRTSVASIAPIEYTGLIFCPTVSTGAFVARRSGKVFITGNSGFPKSLDVSKAIDKQAGAEREIVGLNPNHRVAPETEARWNNAVLSPNVTAPATPEAEQWQGWGTALKPAWEPIIVARKPLTGTVAANVLAFGTGGLNIDGCRVKFVSDDDKAAAAAAAAMRSTADQNANRTAYSDFNNGAASLGPYLANMDKGRWPANVLLDEHAAAILDKQSGDSTSRKGEPRTGNNGDGWGMTATGAEYDDTGGASRFFYCAKTSRSERNAGLEGFEERALNWSSGEQNPGSFQSEGTNRNATNVHPTVKPISLMRWLVRLVTPPNGVVVDPFAGSGSTGCAAILEGFRFVGIELEAEYVKIAQARLDFWREHGEDALRIVAEAEAAEKERETVKESGQLDMFDLLTAGGNA